MLGGGKRQQAMVSHNNVVATIDVKCAMCADQPNSTADYVVLDVLLGI